MSYRKDDRAMRYLHVHTENFPESLSMLTATFAETFNGLCSNWSYECVYKIWSS